MRFAYQVESNAEWPPHKAKDLISKNRLSASRIGKIFAENSI
jgi:hypothetical protein